MIVLLISKKIISKIVSPIVRKKRMKEIEKYGERVFVGGNSRFIGHIELGNNISIGEGAYFVSTRAHLSVKDNCVFGPNVTIYTGDHAIHVMGKHIIDITDDDKTQLEEQFDKDVVVEEGCWIGTRAIILKGVTIGKGSVIGAGAIVTKDVPPYSVYVGSPPYNFKIIPRFSREEILEHEKLLAINYTEERI